MIKFETSKQQALFANLMRHDAEFRKKFNDWYWAHMAQFQHEFEWNEQEGRTIIVCENWNAPNYVVTLSLHPTDEEMRGGELLPREVAWCRYVQPCDKWGIPEGERRFQMNGAWILHSSDNKWGCHT